VYCWTVQIVDPSQPSTAVPEYIPQRRPKAEPGSNRRDCAAAERYKLRRLSVPQRL
jgi:hypothetical protein